MSLPHNGLTRSLGWFLCAVCSTGANTHILQLLANKVGFVFPHFLVFIFSCFVVFQIDPNLPGTGIVFGCDLLGRACQSKAAVDWMIANNLLEQIAQQLTALACQSWLIALL
jgi:hypothetical protein